MHEKILLPPCVSCPERRWGGCCCIKAWQGCFVSLARNVNSLVIESNGGSCEWRDWDEGFDTRKELKMWWGHQKSVEMTSIFCGWRMATLSHMQSKNFSLSVSFDSSQHLNSFWNFQTCSTSFNLMKVNHTKSLIWVLEGLLHFQNKVCLQLCHSTCCASLTSTKHSAFSCKLLHAVPANNTFMKEHGQVFFLCWQAMCCLAQVLVPLFECPHLCKDNEQQQPCNSWPLTMRCTPLAC